MVDGGEPQARHDARQRNDATNRAPARGDFGEEAVYARIILKHRRLRDRALNHDLFSDPAWDMLLDLFASEVEGIRVSKSDLMIAAAVPQSTAMRWIANLVSAGIFHVEQDRADGRRVFVSLPDEQFDRIGNLLRAFRNDLLTGRRDNSRL